MTEQEQASHLQNCIRPLKWRECSVQELETLAKYGKTPAIRQEAAEQLQRRSDTHESSV